MGKTAEEKNGNNVRELTDDGQSALKTYVPPELTIYGPIETVTKGTGGGGTDGGVASV